MPAQQAQVQVRGSQQVPHAQGGQVWQVLQVQ
ncbi:hypothetical protein J2Y00_001978 [Deinococcus soli (ex Cha et al. 2016)]|uniref:Uncharacterized protein n=2 Tax=Deinococcus soli (ex Cha et al. 2016) TaxID=1309411 RepID=A0ACC6KFR8_9DEIO|nr:hypothetical protein [Deinococcus soli (ex Cha et al. 2016)]MDR6329155.1 hypothetical protein [Deinococcus soli (ex Cha et al. 2016)]MDR6751428.1 hypothetical protein [Deinococcus soli (ex Cha et al. 2016)]